MTCIFCDILAGKRDGHIVYEDNKHIAFLDKYPIDDGHTLVIPKKTEYKNNPCPECKAMDTEVNEQDVIDYLQILAAKTGSQLEVISGSAEHGNMLASLGKVGAILRYNPGHTK